jgi:ferritin-like metal-binding protein YciE
LIARDLIYTQKISAAQQAKNEAAVRLMKEWLKDESGYDEETWPRLKAAIEANRLSSRSRFQG